MSEDFVSHQCYLIRVSGGQYSGLSKCTHRPPNRRGRACSPPLCRLHAIGGGAGQAQPLRRPWENLPRLLTSSVAPLATLDSEFPIPNSEFPIPNSHCSLPLAIACNRRWGRASPAPTSALENLPWLLTSSTVLLATLDSEFPIPNSRS